MRHQDKVAAAKVSLEGAMAALDTAIRCTLRKALQRCGDDPEKIERLRVVAEREYATTKAGLIRARVEHFGSAATMEAARQLNLV